MLRDGVYMTEEPTSLALEGVYVAATGRLHARAVLGQPGQLRLPLNESESVAVRDSSEYR